MASLRVLISRCRVTIELTAFGLAALSAVLAGEPSKPPENLFGNPGFEDGRDAWRMDLGGKTAAQFVVDGAEAAAGTRSVRLAIDSVESWGVQFGQRVEGIEEGKTYTIAVLGKAIQGPVTVRLEAERAAKPWDRAGASEPFTLSGDRWTEVHATFRVSKAFPEGCFAYVSCHQAHAEFRLDGFRLYQGPYVPYEKASQDAAQPDRQVRKLAGEVAMLIGQPNAAAECRRLGQEIRRLGALQDRALANARMAARWIRQQAAAWPAQSADVAGLAEKIRARIDQTLGNK